MINLKNIYFSKITFKSVKKLLFILFSFDKKLIFALFNNVAAGTEHMNFFSNIKMINTIVDIGSHNGQFALISKFIYKKAKIFSFDPLKSSKKKYQLLLKKDGYHFLSLCNRSKKYFFKN